MTAAKSRFLRRGLVVEDDPRLLAALARSMEARGIEAHTALTLKSARALLDQDFDLALIDVRLPDGSGLELCASLCGKVPRPVVVALSGAANARDGFLLARLGVGEFVEKPFDEEDLWGAVARNAGVPIEFSAARAVGSTSMHDVQRSVRREMIKEALARGRTITEAARLLGVTRQAVQQAIEDLDLGSP